MRRRKAAFGVLTSIGAAVLVGVAPLSPATSAAEPAGPVPGGFASWDELWRTQSRLNAAAEKIRTAAPDGVSGVVAAPESRELVIYWFGTTPSHVHAVLDEQRRSVPVRVEPAKYSRTQLISEVHRLADQARTAGLPVSDVAPAPDGSGVRVGLPGKGRAAAMAQHPVFAQAAVDLVFEEGVGRPVPADRLNDRPPYFGGARIRGCTAGFGVWKDDRTMMLSAGHCGDHDDLVTDGGGDRMGRIVYDNDQRDTQIINASSMGTMWDGGLDNPFSKDVLGASRSEIGNWLCTSGSYSGVRCGIRVTARDVAIPGLGFRPQVRAEHINRENAAGQGDSGGPVFELPGSGHDRVIAKGTFSAFDGANPAPCTGEQNRDCSWRIWYADITDTLNHHGASILTNGETRAPGGFLGQSVSGDARDEIIAVNRDGDGKVWAYPNTNGLSGGFPFQHGSQLITGRGWGDPAKVRFADIDGDGRSEIIHMEPAGDGKIWAGRNTHALDGDGIPFRAAGQHIHTIFYEPAKVSFGDIDGDGRDEFIIVNQYNDGKVWAHHNAYGLDGPGGDPYPTTQHHIGTGWRDPAKVRFADIDGDHRDEIIYIDRDGDGKIWAYPNTHGLNAFPYQGGAKLITGRGWRDPAKVHFADLDGDGRDDIIAVNRDGDGKVWAYRNTHGFNGFPFQDDPRHIGTGWYDLSTTFFG